MEKIYLSAQTSLLVIILVGFFFIGLGYLNSKKPQIIATGCPFCNTMISDGVKHFNKDSEVKVLDIAEAISLADDL